MFNLLKYKKIEPFVVWLILMATHLYCSFHRLTWHSICIVTGCSEYPYATLCSTVFVYKAKWPIILLHIVTFIVLKSMKGLRRSDMTCVGLLRYG